MIARMRWALPTVEQHAPMVANLYTDLLINDRLQRSAGSATRRCLSRPRAQAAASGAVWTLYLRIYELLWSLERGSLGGGTTDDRLEGDAWLGARLVRSYARDWLDGSGRFAPCCCRICWRTKSQQRSSRSFTIRATQPRRRTRGLDRRRSRRTRGRNPSRARSGARQICPKPNMRMPEASTRSPRIRTRTCPHEARRASRFNSAKFCAPRAWTFPIMTSPFVTTANGRCRI